jgi:hypothetical protein
VQVDFAGNAPVAPQAAGATARALDRLGHHEHEEVRRVQGRDGHAWQLRADRVHVEAARAAAVVHAPDGCVAQVAYARVIHEHGSLEREWMLAMEGQGRGRRARRAELVQVEVAGVATVSEAYAEAAAAVTAEASAAGVVEHQGMLLVGVVDDLPRHYGWMPAGQWCERWS